MAKYGKELIIDIHDCDVTKFNRTKLREFCKKLCGYLDMKAEDLHFWDYYGRQDEYENEPDHIKGTSVIQFIRTSNITIHCLDVLKRVYINIFSCKDFEIRDVHTFICEWFGGTMKTEHMIVRK